MKKMLACGLADSGRVENPADVKNRCYCSLPVVSFQIKIVKAGTEFSTVHEQAVKKKKNPKK